MINRLKVELCGIEMKNPVILASGTCNFGKELNEKFDISKLGGLSLKGLTLNAHCGNSGERVFETASGMMNSVGMENPGVKKFIEKELPRLNQIDTLKIVNLGGHSKDDYIQGIELLNDADIRIIELNISCPNVKSGGMSFGIDAKSAGELVGDIRKICKHKLMVKLSPNAKDIVELAKACEANGADSLSLINTVQAMAVDIRKKKPFFENVYAGLSGPAVKPIALRMVHQVCQNVKIPVVGIGGISSWEDVVEFIMVGASAIQIGTANFANPHTAIKIIEGLESYCEREKLKNINEIKGII